MPLVLSAHQPVFLPWLGLFHKIALADTFVIFDTVQYLKKDWNNRNQIKTAQGPVWLTVPVLTSGKFDQKLTEVMINNSVDWRRKHKKTIELNYKKCPYFSRYFDFFEDLYSREWEKLNDLNDHVFRYLLKCLNINVKVLYGHDLGLVGYKSDLVLDMCKKLGADIYIFGALGKDYADMNAFNSAGVQVVFQEYKHPVYKQSFGDFLPYMSVIDLLFNCGDESYKILMEGNVAKTDIFASSK